MRRFQASCGMIATSLWITAVVAAPPQKGFSGSQPSQKGLSVSSIRSSTPQQKQLKNSPRVSTSKPITSLNQKNTFTKTLGQKSPVQKPRTKTPYFNGKVALPVPNALSLGASPQVKKPPVSLGEIPAPIRKLTPQLVEPKKPGSSLGIKDIPVIQLGGSTPATSKVAIGNGGLLQKNLQPGQFPAPLGNQQAKCLGGGWGWGGWNPWVQNPWNWIAIGLLFDRFQDSHCHYVHDCVTVAQPVVVRDTADESGQTIVQNVIVETEGNDNSTDDSADAPGLSTDRTKLRVGSTFHLPASGLGEAAGQVAVRIGPVFVPCMISEWNAEGLHATIGPVALASSTPAELVVMTASGEPAAVLPIELLPMEQDPSLASNENKIGS